MIARTAFILAKQSFLIIFLLHSFTGTGQFKKAPDWVRSVPVSGDAFYGIGTSLMREDTDYKSLAQKLALKDLTDKIFVSINSESAVSLTYENDQAVYEIDELTEFESSNFLTGYHKVDDWIDNRNKTYYTLFKLNRTDYLENRRNYYLEVNEVLRMMGAEAEDLITEGSIVRGINKLADALQRIEVEMSKTVEPEYRVSLEKIQLSFIFQLEEQLHRIEFVTNNRYLFDLSDPEPLVIREFLKDRITGRTVQHTKSRIKITSGDLFHYEFDRKTPGEELVIRGIFPENRKAEFTISTEIPLPETILRKLDPTVTNHWESRSIVVDFIPYSIQYISEEYNSRDENAKEVLTDYLRSITDDLGFAETDTSRLTLHVQSRKDTRGAGRGQYEAIFEASIQAFTGQEPVYYYRFNTEKSYASKRSTAFRRAFHFTVNEDKKFLVSFVTFLCTKHAW